MLTLYVKTGCPYCEKTIDVAKELGVDFVRRNIEDEGVAEELIAKGGKRQMPYLIDSDRGVAMYESEDIMRYLREQYPKRD